RRHARARRAPRRDGGPLEPRERDRRAAVRCRRVRRASVRASQRRPRIDARCPRTARGPRVLAARLHARNDDADRRRRCSPVGDWTTATREPPRTPLVAGPSTPELAYIDRPGADYTSIVIGRRAFAAGDARQIAADVENALVGGEGSSLLERAMQTLDSPGVG